MKVISEAASSPQVAVPLTSGVALSNVFQVLPDIINIGTVVYLSLLIVHKAWTMYQEYKQRKENE